MGAEACVRTAIRIRIRIAKTNAPATGAIIKDGHARIIIMRPETILHSRPDTFSQTASPPTQFFLHSSGGPYMLRQQCRTTDTLLWLLARSATSPGNCGPKIDAACEVRLNLTALSGQASGVVSSL